MAARHVTCADVPGGLRRGAQLTSLCAVLHSPAPASNTDERGRSLPDSSRPEQWLSGTQLEREIKLRDYSVSNRGLMPGLVGTPAQVRARIEEYEAVGLDLLLLQMSPQMEEMDRFANTIISEMKAH